MKMGYFLVRYGTEVTLLKLRLQILDKIVRYMVSSKHSNWTFYCSQDSL